MLIFHAFENKIDHPKKFDKSYGKATVIHGWDIKVLSFDYFSLEILIVPHEKVFSESLLYPRSEQQMKRKRPGEQQQHLCRGHQTSATIVLNSERCVYFRGNTVSRRFGGTNNSYHKETIVFNNYTLRKTRAEG